MRLTRVSILSSLFAVAYGCGKKPDAVSTVAESSTAVASKPGIPTAPTVPTEPPKPPILDSEGNPLPAGAVLRLGLERAKTDKDFSGAVRRLAFGAEGKEILSGADGGTACRWNAADGKLLEKIDLQKIVSGLSQYTSPHFLGDGRRAIYDKELYEVSGVKKYAKLPSDLAYFPTRDGSYIATIGGIFGEKKVVASVYAAGDGKALGSVELPAKLYRAGAAYSAKKKMLLTAYSYRNEANQLVAIATAWEMPTGRKLGEIALPDGSAISGIALTDDAKIVVANLVGHLVVIDFNGEPSLRKIDDPGRVSCKALTVSQDGKLVAVCQTTTTKIGEMIRVYDLETGAIRHTIDGRNDVVLSDKILLMNLTSPPEIMAFSPDGTRLAVPALSSVLVYDLTKIGK